MNYKEKAAYYHSLGYNCAQAVACAFEDKSELPHEQLFEVSEAFGLGMGNMQGTCGALSGALMILSQIESTGKTHDQMPKSKANTYARAKNVMETFKETTGTVICKELKTQGPTFTPCPRCIELACEILEKELNK